MNRVFKREVACLGFSGTDFVSITTNNTPGAVEFDFFRAWEYYKANKGQIKDVVMIHTHPPGFDSMSSTDVNMLDGWLKTFKGLDIFYCIQQPEFTNIFTNGNNVDSINRKDYGNFQKLVATILDYLSYKEEDVKESEIEFFEQLICQALVSESF